MTIFETERLIIKSIEPSDKKYFTELFTDPKILELIPQIAYSNDEIDNRFDKSLNLNLKDLKTEKRTCGIFEKGNSEMIGLCLFLINDKKDNELGYRFRSEYWGKGYGTEVTKGQLDFYFNVLKVEKVTAEVNIANVGSLKILNKFMIPLKDFFDEQHNFNARSYELDKKNWLHYDN